MSVMTGVAVLLWANAGFKASSPGGVVAVLVPEQVKAYPVTTYQVVGGSSSPTFETSGMQKLRVQFDHHGASYASVDAARIALRKALEGYSGTLSDGTVLQNAEWLQPIDFYDYEPRQFRCSAEYYLWFTLQ